MQSSAAAWFLKIGCRTSDGINFQVCVSAAAYLLGSFKGCSRVLGKVTKQSECMVFGGGKEMGFCNCFLASA